MPSVRDSNGREIRTRDGGSVYSGSGPDSDRSSRNEYNPNSFSYKSEHYYKPRSYHNLDNKEKWIIETLERKERSILENIEAKERAMLDRLQQKTIEYQNTIKELNKVMKEISYCEMHSSKAAKITENVNSYPKINDIKILKQVNSIDEKNSQWKIYDLEDEEVAILDNLERRKEAILNNLENTQPTKERVFLIDTFHDIAKNQLAVYGEEKVKDYAKGKLKDTAFFVAKVATSHIPPLNMAVRGVEKVSNVYDKVDKTEEINLIQSIKDDVKQIDLNQYSPEETGYEFVKSIQHQSSEEEIAAFHDRVNLVADTIQEGY